MGMYDTVRCDYKSQLSSKVNVKQKQWISGWVDR